MTSFRSCAALLFMLVAPLSPLHAQEEPPPEPPPLILTLAPPTGTIWVEETSNDVFVTINDPATWSNVSIQGTYNGTDSVTFYDDGTAPDVAAADGTFSASIQTPLVGSWSIETPLVIQASAEVYVEPTDPPQDPPPDPIVSEASAEATYIVVARPWNDDFENAGKLPAEGGSVISTNSYASLQTGEPLHAGLPGAETSVWWTWSPKQDVDTLIDLTGTPITSVLAIYRGATLEELTPVTSSQDNPADSAGPFVQLTAQAGITYRIAVSGKSPEDAGQYFLRVVPNGLPDTTGPAVTILQPASETLTATNVLAITGVAKDPQPNGLGVAEVYFQVNQGPETLATGTNSWEAVLDLSPGTNIVQAFAVDVAGNQGPKDTIVVRFKTPLNDDFADAAPLDELAGIVNAMTETATLEPDEPFHALNEGGHSVWYAFRAPANGTLTLSTLGSDFDTLLAVYQGTSLTNLTEIISNDDATPDETYSATSATVALDSIYYIAVDGYGADSGYLELQYTFVTSDRFYQLDYTSSLGGTISPAAGLYLEGSQLSLSAAPSRDFVFDRWQGTISSSDNPLQITMDSNHQIEAVFHVKHYTEDFETGSFGPWFHELPENAIPWRINTNQIAGGEFAAQCGITADNQKSSLIMRANLMEGTASFAVKTSSEPFWDVLEFYLNGTKIADWSGETPWQTYMFHVPAGPNTLEWRYSKDANFSRGLDSGFIDNIYLPLSDATLAPQVSLILLPENQLQIQAAGFPGRTLQIEISNDLSNWTPVATDTPDDGILLWVDPEPLGSQNQSYYRATTD